MAVLKTTSNQKPLVFRYSKKDKLTPSKQKEVKKVRAELNETENRNTIEKTNKTRCWLSERTNNIGKLSAKK